MNGFPTHCRPDRLCDRCKHRGTLTGPIQGRTRTRRPSNNDWAWQTTKGVYGGSVQGGWRRSNWGRWKRS